MNDTSSSIFDLDLVREKVADLYRKIGATRDYVTFGNPRYDATPDVDIKITYDFVNGINGTPIPRKYPRKSYTFISRERGGESRNETIRSG